MKQSVSFKLKQIGTGVKDSLSILYLGLSNSISKLFNTIETNMEFKRQLKKAELSGMREQKLAEAHRIGIAKAQAQTNYKIQQIKQQYKNKHIKLNQPKQISQLFNTQQSDTIGIPKIDIMETPNKKQKQMEWF